MGNILKDWIAIYRQPHMGPLCYEFFCCQAEDYDHAEEQCVNAYPNADVLWIVQTVHKQEALDDWLSAGEKHI